MLLALTCAFALSQAYRTVAAIMAPALQQDFGLSAQGLGAFAAMFHFAFGGLQLAMGIGVDVHGVRRTVLAAFPLAIAGALLSAIAPGFGTLLAGQALIGIGCAPAFLVCTVFIARQFPPERFASVSGTVLAIGGMGMLLTGTPLAWVIEGWSWRAGFVALALLSALAWLAIWRWVREPASGQPGSVQRETLAGALRGFAQLFTFPHTWGILALGAVAYASFVTLRGLWLGPMMVERHALSLVQAGNVAVVVTVVSLVGPPLFGKLDPGDRTRRRWIVGWALASATLFGVLAFGLGLAGDLAVLMVLSLVLGFMVLQYADVRSAYPPSMTGRALSLFTMSMFLGVALVQWITGLVAEAALGFGMPVGAAVMAALGGLLALGAAAFRGLPQPRPR
jgi:predicted MFS family arabinose efflux permease